MKFFLDTADVGEIRPAAARDDGADGIGAIRRCDHEHGIFGAHAALSPSEDSA